MSKFSARNTADENAKLKIAVRDIISQLETANKRMAERRVRIDRLAAETRAILDEIKTFTFMT